MRKSLRLLLAAITTAALLSCSTPQHTKPAAAVTPIPLPSVTEDKPKDYPGIHNAVSYHDGFVSGSAPEGDAGFNTLQAMGVKTIISVDGIEPDVAQAKARGIRYIHLPIGYNGFDEQRKLQLVRATRDAMKDGPVYIHCHHGKHRSAGAAATVATSLGWEAPDQGVARMKVSGTSPDYKGLYSCASNAQVLGASVIDNVPANFPSVSKPSGYVKGMDEIDDAFDHLKQVEKAGWTVPKDHPDLVPIAEAGRLADLFRALHNTDYVKKKPAELGPMMQTANTLAQKLEDMLQAGEKDAAKLSAQFKLVGASCKDCHTKFRD